MITGQGVVFMKTVWVYVNTNVQVGDVNHLKVFANPDAAEEWFNLQNPEGAVFGYPLIGEFDELGPRREAGSADEHDAPKAEE
jgi:hypothetical protein